MIKGRYHKLCGLNWVIKIKLLLIGNPPQEIE